MPMTEARGMKCIDWAASLGHVLSLELYLQHMRVDDQWGKIKIEILLSGKKMA